MLLSRECERSSAECGGLTRRRQRHLTRHHSCSLWFLKGVLLDGPVGGVVVPRSGPRYGIAARVRDTKTRCSSRIWRSRARRGWREWPSWHAIHSADKDTTIRTITVSCQMHGRVVGSAAGEHHLLLLGIG